jgi:thiamine pyrophosphate-dependent acetolactate synthase large subunit-like protein
MMRSMPGKAGATPGGPARRPVYEAVGPTLSALGVDTVFGVMGDGNMRFLADMTDRCGMRYLAARHESAAVSMARGYAHATGRPGVATVTQGPGLANSVTALVEVVRAREPVLLITGEVPAGSLGHAQELDQRALLHALGVTTQTLRAPDTIVEDLARAFHLAAVRQTAVVISIPTHWQSRPIEEQSVPTLAEHVALRPAPDPAVVRVAADLAEGSRRPVIIAGRGAARPAGGTVIEALGDRIGALYATSVAGKGVLGFNELCLGIAGDLGDDDAAELMAGADLVIALGASLNHQTTRRGQLVGPSAAVIQCDVDGPAIGRHQPVTLGIVADCLSFARALTDELARRGVHQAGYRTADVRQRLPGRRAQFEDASTDEVIDPRRVMCWLDKVVPVERTVLTDGGLFSVWPLLYLDVPDAAAFDWGQAFQSVGLGVGAAIGAAVGRPDRRTVLIAGDGGMMMSLGDLETAIRHRVPLLVVVLNDGAYGAEIGQLKLLGLPDRLARFGDVDFAAIAGAMGFESLTVRSLADLEVAVHVVAEVDRPTLLDCRVSAQVRDRWFAETFGSKATEAV